MQLDTISLPERNEGRALPFFHVHFLIYREEKRRGEEEVSSISSESREKRATTPLFAISELRLTVRILTKAIISLVVIREDRALRVRREISWKTVFALFSVRLRNPRAVDEQLFQSVSPYQRPPSSVNMNILNHY